jgi:gas vesicle protein
MLGHNNPPEALSLLAEKLALFKAGAVAFGPIDDNNAQECRDHVGYGAKLAKEIDGQRDSEKRPHLEAGRAVDAAYKPLLEAVDDIQKALKTRLQAFVVEREREAKRIADEARRKAEEAERAAQAAQAEEDAFLAATAPTVNVAEAVVEAKVAESMALASARVSSAAGGFAAAGLRTKRSAKVTDWSLLAQHYIGNGELRACLERLANSDIRHAKGADITIPGVEILTERVL